MIDAQKNQVNYVTATEADVGQRLDNFLFKHYKGVPKSHIYRIIRKGEVRINKKRVKQTTRLVLNDSIRLPPLRVSQQQAQPASERMLEKLEANILYEDAGVMVLNKPVGVAVHGGSGVRLGVIEALRQLRSEANMLELIHRLDRDTSGCLLIAKKRAVLREFHRLFREDHMDKQYLALVKGQWLGGDKKVDLPLHKNQLQSGERMVRVDHQTGKTAISYFSLVTQYADAALVRVRLKTGRTHQIRVHAKAIGYPLAMDDKYGDKAFNKQMKARGLTRLFLHAEILGFSGSSALANMPQRFIAPLPDELQAVLAVLAK